MWDRASCLGGSAEGGAGASATGIWKGRSGDRRASRKLRWQVAVSRRAGVLNVLVGARNQAVRWARSEQARRVAETPSPELRQRATGDKLTAPSFVSVNKSGCATEDKSRFPPRRAGLTRKKRGFGMTWAGTGAGGRERKRSERSFGGSLRMTAVFFQKLKPSCLRQPAVAGAKAPTAKAC